MINTKALREKILDLAMHGKLVPQDPTDEPASVLLDKIKEEKEQLIKDKKIKKEKPLPKISKEEIPYEIPDSWEWVRMVDIQDVRDGTHDTPKYVTEGVPLITSKNLKGNQISFENVKYISVKDAEKIDQRSKVSNGDILFAMIGTIGNPVLVQTHKRLSIKNVALLKQFSNKPINKFVLRYLQFQQEIMKKNSAGGLQKFYSLTMIRKMLCPLPPLYEQKRIVAKIEELFALIDTIESNQLEFKQLTEQLDKKILDLAMHGKLVPQDPTDEPASVLLDKIKEEKEQLIKDKKIKKEKALPEISKEEIPYEIPDSWEWVSIRDISTITMGQAPKSSNVNNEGNGFEFHQGKTFFSSMYVEQSGVYTTSPNKVINPPAIIMSVRAPVGDVNLIDRKIVIGRGLAAFVPGNGIELLFLYNYLQTQKSYLLSLSTGTTFKAINSQTVRTINVPLPPLKEQKRIVAKIEMIRESIQRIDFE
ncbi:restriction endonuclease subunit S [Enterococcus sp. DIV1271a]|uniref:restriction endonuclease subunit S n=1 Tax=Enterococcus sp. DIV1271a TaxID=2815327 RepID=UPI001A9C273F|nr:restriction endonuclease subunit S [Enterococcus sp. DIV1271a]MBO1301079.1 restriction endonuclease subunit S [Enterococcus sp. DIV1271a]